jgi:hypothetical protein
MVQASTSAAFTADEARAGTVLAAEMIAAAAVLIATAAAIRLTGEGKPRGAGAAEPTAVSRAGPPLRGAVSLEGRGPRPPVHERPMPMDAVHVLTIVVLAFGGLAAAFAWAEAQNHGLSK